LAGQPHVKATSEEDVSQIRPSCAVYVDKQSTVRSLLKERNTPSPTVMMAGSPRGTSAR
jgi:hypothetical protein